MKLIDVQKVASWLVGWMFPVKTQKVEFSPQLFFTAVHSLQSSFSINLDYLLYTFYMSAYILQPRQLMFWVHGGL